MVATGYLIALLFFLGGCAFVLAGLATADLLNALFLRKSRSRDKRTTYESGETPIGGAWIQFPLAFYIFALLFVAFDVDIVFILSWAVIFQQLGLVRLRRDRRSSSSCWRLASSTPGGRGSSDGSSAAHSGAASALAACLRPRPHQRVADQPR